MSGSDFSISVVITTKNEGKNLPRLLDSLAMQQGPFEIIIADSESTDNTAEIITEYSRKLPIRFISKRTSRGGGRNLGVAESSAPYVLFLDGDVEVEDGLLSGYRERLAEGADVVAGHSLPSGLEKFKLERVKLFVDGFEITAPSANLCYRVELFRKIGGFDETFVTAEDIDLNFRAVIAGARTIACEKCMVLNRTRSSTGAFLRQAFWNGYGRYQLRRKNRENWSRISKGKPLRGNIRLHNILRLSFGSLGYLYSILRRGRFP